jgi:hypothetical protein
MVSILDRWQTLIAGLLALGGAWLTVRGIRQQIAQVTQIEQDRRLREERAARAVLPLALNALFQYTIDCITQLQPFIKQRHRNQAMDITHMVPKIPQAIFEPLRTYAKFGDSAMADKIQHLLHALQIQHYRLTTVFQKSYENSTKADIIDNLILAADLNAQIYDLFDNARGGQPIQKYTLRAKMISALFRCGIVAEEHPDILSAIDEHISTQLESTTTGT